MVFNYENINKTAETFANEKVGRLKINFRETAILILYPKK